ncbi:MAG: lysine biosynthesis protein LysX [Desulfurococcaceae archaeon]
MKLGIVYEVIRWEEKALMEAARELGVELKLIHLHSVYMPIGSSDKDHVDIALQRAISHAIALNSTIALESANIRVINNSLSTAIAMNKLWTAQILVSRGIKVPRTIIAFDHEPSTKAVEALGGYPVVIKPIDGSWGRLVSLARDHEELRSLLEHRSFIPNPIMRIFMIQEFVKKPGRDIRVFVIGEEVPVAIYRASEHWITNTARGGVALPAKVDSELEEIAIKTAKAIGGEFMGIDVFEDPERGYIVNEVNAVPEFKNTVRVTGYKVHVKVIEYVKQVARK